MDTPNLVWRDVAPGYRTKPIRPLPTVPMPCHQAAASIGAQAIEQYLNNLSSG